MQFIRTGKRAPKGLRTSEVIDVDLAGKLAQGEFYFADASTLVLSFRDSTKVAMVIQKATTYSEKKPTEDALSKFVAPPADNDAEDDTPPLNPPAK